MHNRQIHAKLHKIINRLTRQYLGTFKSCGLLDEKKISAVTLCTSTTLSRKACWQREVVLRCVDVEQVGRVSPDTRFWHKLAGSSLIKYIRKTLERK
jgi:hypothetical protein